jgi:cyclophilin family peptidyl-prolyl cis-trans isomerase
MMLLTRPHHRAQIEPLEARIAPAVILANPLPDIVAGSGKTGATIDLAAMVDAGALYPNRTLVEFTTNVDADSITPGLQPGKIVIELFDDEAPLTVQNFLAYVNSKNAKSDYDNTIIHRSFDFGPSSGPGIDIIQGGGFETFGPGAAHVVTGPEVHNEYSNAQPNIRGTIAMAKTALSPNTATSEWFFNVNDNSSILGEGNNGGFTVFGRVVSGMEFVDIIAGLETVNVGGATTNLPVQNYNSDPDNNPFTPPPTPKTDQLIRIVDTKVLTTTGMASGVTFSVESIVPVGDTPTGLLTATVTGATLNLKYNTAKSGFADVTVKATPSDGSEPVFDTFRVDVRPNLIVNIDSDGFQGMIVPGDNATVKLHLTNNGAAVAAGTVDIEIGLAKMHVENGTLVLNSPLEVVTLARLNDFDLNLAGGKTQSFSPKVTVLTSLAPTDGAFFTLIARVVPEGDLASNERFTDDNVGYDGGRHELVNRFGTFTSSNGFGTRTNVALTYADADAAGNQTLVTWTMKGAGWGRVTPDASKGVLVETFATDTKSTLNAAVGKGAAHAVVERMQLQTPLGTANLGNVDLTEYLFASGGVKMLTLGDVRGQATMLIGAFPPDNTTKTTLKLGSVQDLSLESAMPIALLSATEWRDTEGTPNDYITTIGLETLKITGAKAVRGDFQADITNNDSTAIKSISIAGFLSNSTIRTFGDITTVNLGGMDSSKLLLGVGGRPAGASDFGDALTLKTFTIKGIKGYTGDLFIDSQVAAANLGTVTGINVATASGSGDFGFVADEITRYNRAGFKTASKVTLPTVIEDQGNYKVQVL